MKIFLIGVGYVGMSLLNCLNTEGHDVYVSTTKKERVEELRKAAKKVIVLNESDNKPFEEIVKECDAIVVMVAPKNHSNYEETYLKTAKMIATAVKKRENPVYLLYTGSTSVYEGADEEWSTEVSKLHPTSENPKILLETEQVYLNCGTSCVLRLGGIFGPERTFNERAKRLSGQEYPGTGLEPTNHIHLEDIVSGIIFCIDNRLEGVYNLVNDDHPSRDELYEELCGSLNIPLPIWKSRGELNQPRGYKVSNKKIKDAGFEFKHSLYVKYPE